jgi:hypothetical protein
MVNLSPVFVTAGNESSGAIDVQSTTYHAIFFDTTGTMIFVIQIHHSDHFDFCFLRLYPPFIKSTTVLNISLQPDVFEISYL